MNREQLVLLEKMKSSEVDKNIDMLIQEPEQMDLVKQDLRLPTELAHRKETFMKLSTEEQLEWIKKRQEQRIDKLFDLPLTVSICMLAMAHGSNEINVSAPLTAEIFMLQGKYTQIVAEQEYIAIFIGLFSVIIGSVTLGVRYLDKFRTKFMRVTLSNGFIANTCVSLCLFFASFFGFTVSCTYILAPCLLMLTKKDKGKRLNLLKAAMAVVFAISITLGSMLLSVCVSWLLLDLDYNGPYSGVEDYINYNIN